MKRGHLQTMHIAFEQICAGEREWTALGNFMNYWYAYAKDRREELVADPLPAYDEQSLYQHQWAVFYGRYFVRLRLSGFATSIMFPVPPGCMIQNITCPNPGFFISMSLLNPGFCKQPQKSSRGAMCIAAITVMRTSGSWLNSTGGVLLDSN